VNFADVRKYIDSLCRRGVDTEVKLNMIYHQAKFNRDVAVDAQQQLQEYAERIRTLEAELEEARESLQISQGKQAQFKRASRRMSQELNALKESGGSEQFSDTVSQDGGMMQDWELSDQQRRDMPMLDEMFPLQQAAPPEAPRERMGAIRE